jgi:hypothetical protein
MVLCWLSLTEDEKGQWAQFYTRVLEIFELLHPRVPSSAHGVQLLEIKAKLAIVQLFDDLTNAACSPNRLPRKMGQGTRQRLDRFKGVPLDPQDKTTGIVSCLLLFCCHGSNVSKPSGSGGQSILTLKSPIASFEPIVHPDGTVDPSMTYSNSPTLDLPEMFGLSQMQTDNRFTSTGDKPTTQSDPYTSSSGHAFPTSSDSCFTDFFNMPGMQPAQSILGEAEVDPLWQQWEPYFAANPIGLPELEPSLDFAGMVSF